MIRRALFVVPAALAALLVATPVHAAPKEQVVNLDVTKEGFVPAQVKVKAGQPVKLVVTRKTEVTCATEIVMKDFGVKADLPLEKAVTVVVTPKKPGAYRYTCGMDMIAGVLPAE